VGRISAALQELRRAANEDKQLNDEMLRAIQPSFPCVYTVSGGERVTFGPVSEDCMNDTAWLEAMRQRGYYTV
jgi:hypothetical protein